MEGPTISDMSITDEHFVVDGKAAVSTFASNLANLGDTKTLVIHPASTIYRDLTPDEQHEAGVYDDLIRISVGIESIDDIIADFRVALS